MKKYANTRKVARLSSFPTVSIEDEKDKLTERCKFNFHYMDFSQSAGQHFQDWEVNNQLAKLLDKLRYYCENSLKYWQRQRIGRKNNTVLEIYDSFPQKSDFVYPKHVPHDVLWARFRIEWDARLIGFVIPSDQHGRIHRGTGEGFDCNTFYVVFLDKNHRFWKNEK